MNPYDFVRIDWSKGVKRQRPQLHHRFSGLSGRVHGTITTLTPLFIPGEEVRAPFQDPYKRFLTRADGHRIIPGSSLKGLLRSLVETIGNGCWCFPKPVHQHYIPEDFRACTDRESLCVACRMFGMIHGDNHLAGHVGFEDATCEDPELREKMYTPALMGPQPDKASGYLESSTNETRVAGRKFYYHSREIWVDKEIHETSSGIQLNSYIEPVDVSNAFAFAMHFDNLVEEELGLLLYALFLEPSMRHKLGYAKPAGLGSVEIKATRLELIDLERRYTSTDGGKTLYEGVALEDFVSELAKPYSEDQDSITRKDLLRIWQWRPTDTVRGYQAWELRCDRQPIGEAGLDQ